MYGAGHNNIGKEDTLYMVFHKIRAEVRAQMEAQLAAQMAAPAPVPADDMDL